MKRSELEVGMKIAYEDRYSSLQRARIVALDTTEGLDWGRARNRESERTTGWHRIEIETGPAKGRLLTVSSKSIKHRWDEKQEQWEAKQREELARAIEVEKRELALREEKERKQNLIAKLAILGLEPVLSQRYLRGSYTDVVEFSWEQFEVLHALLSEHIQLRFINDFTADIFDIIPNNGD